MRSKRIVYPDILRILAAFLVVLAHVTSVGISDYEIGSLTWSTSLALNSICHWSVNVFFMISGMLFLDPSRELPLKKFFTRNIGRILLCIVVWGFFYSLLDQYIYGTISMKSLLLAAYGILSGNTGYHLWFLYTLLALYIATPILRIFTAHATKRQIEYALVVWLLFSVLVGQVNALAAHFLGMEDLLPYEAPAITGYAGFFLLGYYLSAYPIPEKWVRPLYSATVLCLIGMPGGNIVLSELTNVKAIDAITMPMGIGNFVIAAGAYVFASRLPAEKYSLKARRAIRWFSERTFGIYLTHVFFVALVFKILKLDVLTFCPPIMLIVNGLVIFFFSALCSLLLTRIPGVRRIM